MKRANLGSPDSQYGFSSTPIIDGGGPYTVLDPRSSGGMTTCPTGMPGAEIGEGGFYSWGPPPPYASNRNSANNSPARRSLGDLLHHVSPIRRNDNVSPAGPPHHVHRHHLHHSRPCGTSPRQMVNNSLPPNDPMAKDISTRNPPITRQQPSPGMEQSWTNNFSTPHRFPKVVQNKDDYENMYGQENLPPSGGFNTLPSLKKRNQVRVSDFFQNEASTAYIFSSAENLGCSTSNVQGENHFQNKSLPPRIYLSSGQPNTSTYNPISVTASHKYESKNQSDSDLLSSTNQHLPGKLEGSDGLSASRPLRSLDRNTSLVTKLFVNYSPTKEKAKNSQDSLAYAVERKDNFRPMQAQRKKISKKLEPPPNYDDRDPNENIITFHYRVGIPRSPNIQNFNQFSVADGRPGSIAQVENRKDGCVAWPKDRATDGSQVDGNRAMKGMKYISKDVELFQKHNTVIKEFNKNLDVRRNLRSKGGADIRKPKGIENEGFQQSEDHSREILKQPHSKNLHGNMKYNLSSHSPKNEDARLGKIPLSKEVESKEEFLGSAKGSENGSEIYFGDISNLSCYMSVQNDEPDSLIYEEAMESRISEPKKANSFQPILNKQHLRMMEMQNQGYQELVQDYKPFHDIRQQHQENTNFARRQNLESLQYGYRQNRRNNQYRESNKELPAEEFRTRPIHQEAKSQRWPFMGPSHLGSEKDNKGKYYAPESLQDSYLNSDHRHESITSTDEQSLSSLTVDSGISSGKNFMNNCFENTYQELEFGSRDKDHAAGTQRPDKMGDQISHFQTEINNGFGNFAHPLFQKPKVLPRRVKEPEFHEIKMLGVDESMRGNELELKDQTGGNRTPGDLPKMEEGEGVSNQLLSTCSLTLNNDADLFLEEDGLRFDAQQEILSAQKENFEETNRNLPKPLPRTSVSNNRNAPESSSSANSTSSKIYKYSQGKEKVNHFSATDAQY